MQGAEAENISHLLSIVVIGKGRESFLTTFSATERRGVYGGSTFKECRKTSGMERKQRKINGDYAKNLSSPLWEQDAAGSNPVTRTIFLRKTACLGGFSAF